MLEKNQSTYVVVGEVPRLESLGPLDFELIEAQFGNYLGTDAVETISLSCN